MNNTNTTRCNGILLLKQEVYNLTNDKQFTTWLINDISRITNDIMSKLLLTQKHLIDNTNHIYFPQFVIEYSNNNNNICIKILTPFNITADTYIDISKYKRGKRIEVNISKETT